MYQETLPSARLNSCYFVSLFHCPLIEDESWGRRPVMTVSSDLHQLIRSLNKNEKAYFKKFAQLHVLGEENNYVLLFDAIAEMEKYDEESLKKKFSKEDFIRQISVAKNYLYNLVLKSLRSFHVELNARIKARQMLHNIAILFEKGLHDQCEREMNRARKIALKHELYMEQIELLVWELKILLMNQSFEDKMMKLMNENYESRKTVLRKLLNLYEIDQLEYNVASLLRKTPATSAALRETEKLLKSSVMKDESQALSVTAQLKFHHTHATYYYAAGNNKACRKHLLREIQILEKNPDLMELRFQDYVLLYDNLLLLLKDDKDKSFPVHLKKLRDQLSQRKLSTRMFAQVGLRNYLMEIEWLIDSEKYAEALKVADALEEIAKQKNVKPGLNDLLSILHHRTIASLFSGKTDDALKYSFQILNEPEAQQKYVSYDYARLLHIILLFETDNIDVADSQIRSLQRQPSKDKAVEQIAVVIFPALRKLHKTFSKKEKQILWNELADSMKKLKSQKEMQGVFRFFDGEKWVGFRVSY